MANSFPKLDIPDQTETIAFRALEKVFKNDPRLSNVVRFWATWTGDMNIDMMKPTFGTCPFFRLSPFPDASDWVTESQHDLSIIVQVELFTAGSDVNQIMNLWGATRRALFPAALSAKQAIMTSLQAVGISKPIITRASYGVIQQEEGVVILTATGMIKLVLLVQT